MNTFENRIRILEHLSYILECVAAVIPGEAKYELDRLIENIEATFNKTSTQSIRPKSICSASKQVNDKTIRVPQEEGLVPYLTTGIKHNLRVTG
jgi:hypothetical protein